MWYEEDNQFVRAPTPKGLDSLVNDLENRDSVLFESIALPKAKIEEPPKSTPIEAPSSMIGDLQALNLSDDESTLDFTISNESRKQALEEAHNMQKMISELEFTLREKEAILEEKEDEISELKAKLKGKRTRPSTTNDSNSIYREKYQAVLKELSELKRSLAIQGKVRKVKVRALTPVDVSKSLNKK